MAQTSKYGYLAQKQYCSSPNNETCLFLFRYSACIRQEDGFGCIQYNVCTDVTNGFTLDAANGAAIAETESKNGRASCSEDYIVIEGATVACTCGSFNNNLVSRLCGVRLNVAEALTENVPVCGKLIFLFYFL